MTVLVTGAAGFIGFHMARALLERGDRVIGVDNVNAYYDVTLKEARLAVLGKSKDFELQRVDVADRAAMIALVEKNPGITQIIHLAAQAGVRHSLTDPYAYTHSNVEGQLVVLECGRRLENLKHLVYASSSSVYGSNTKLPFSIQDRVDTPVSLYAATKRTTELLSHAYGHLYAIPLTGLRFFTVYGPWGRPDMAAFIFTRKILAGEPIPVFNHGDMRRDFTYIDDVVNGTLACLDSPPKPETQPSRVYNLGNYRSERLTDFIALIEAALDRKAEIEFLPLQPGDVKETYADISESVRDFGFSPSTPISEGIPRFIAWYREYFDV